MKKYLNLVFAFVSSLLMFIKPSLEARCGGKIDIGAAYVHLDILEHHKTVQTLNLPGVKADATIMIKDGFCLKPSILYASGKGSLVTGGVGLGHCFPLFNNRLTLTPYGGCNFTSIHTTIDLPMFGLKHLKERFRSVSPYIALEAAYNITDRWRICGYVQYAWSRTHTIIKRVANDKSNSKGPNYAAMIEYDLTKKWSIHVGAAYNITLTREKHGIRGAGCKVGVARWF